MLAAFKSPLGGVHGRARPERGAGHQAAGGNRRGALAGKDRRSSFDCESVAGASLARSALSAIGATEEISRRGDAHKMRDERGARFFELRTGRIRRWRPVPTWPASRGSGADDPPPPLPLRLGMKLQCYIAIAVRTLQRFGACTSIRRRSPRPYRLRPRPSARALRIVPHRQDGSPARKRRSPQQPHRYRRGSLLRYPRRFHAIRRD